MIKPVIDSFKNNNSYEQATMGVYAYDKEVIPYLDSNINFGKGIYVVQIIKNGPASKTDLKEGDIITLVDGKALNTMNDLREYIYSKKPNDVVSLQIVRGKINKTIEITQQDINEIKNKLNNPTKIIEKLQINKDSKVKKVDPNAPLYEKYHKVKIEKPE